MWSGNLADEPKRVNSNFCRFPPGEGHFVKFEKGFPEIVSRFGTASLNPTKPANLIVPAGIWGSNSGMYPR